MELATYTLKLPGNTNVASFPMNGGASLTGGVLSLALSISEPNRETKDGVKKGTVMQEIRDVV